jgi:hypothetical protein
VRRRQRFQINKFRSPTNVAAINTGYSVKKSPILHFGQTISKCPGPAIGVIAGIGLSDKYATL